MDTNRHVGHRLYEWMLGNCTSQQYRGEGWHTLEFIKMHAPIPPGATDLAMQWANDMGLLEFKSVRGNNTYNLYRAKTVQSIIHDIQKSNVTDG